jgi:hypothetical protein
MARAYVELPDGWGLGRVVLVRVRALGYEAVQWVSPGDASWLEVR